MTHSPLRVAIVGTGMIGAVHRRAARDAGADVIGVLGSSAAKSQRFAAEWGVPGAFSSFDEVLAAKPDVVQICTPNATHHGYALAALEAGVHVVCEKPLALDSSQAQELVDAADRAGVVATVPFVYRYHPLVRELRARRAAGELGDVLLVHGSYLQDWLLDPKSSSWRVDAAASGRSRAFADIGSHWCDLAEFISGERFERVSAVTSIAYPERPVPSGPSFSSASEVQGAGSGGSSGGPAAPATMPVTTEDTAVATFVTARGVTANTVISQVSAGRKNRLWVEVDGTAGSAAFDQENPNSVWMGTDEGARILERASGAVAGDQQRLDLVPAGHPQGYPDAFSAFLGDTYAAVRSRQAHSEAPLPEGLPTFRDGLRAARIIDAVLASADAGSWESIGG
ncbi:Gfo/Idh/MocA family protein [Frondihabitans australicus]|uniref:Putative dehydrogenase n=1 Tax=Frondihabitans australicus TaxID=386892 RepID=A0A495INA0_9MICO|nr:Gfo/Idh/MocA family oxidoreductase [Frondihabitans australicus]RKR76661.1 putative dehydrogenase [Frondihabitans australicus]